MRSAGSPFSAFSEKNSEKMPEIPDLTFFVVVKSMALVYNAIDYAKIYR